jgi:muramoyltetrapeptide carboxypeptidase
MITQPPYLKPNDLIGIVCPAGFMAAEKVQPCVDTLKNWGYRVKLGNTVGGSSTTYFSGTDDERLTDLQQMMDDEEVKAILCGRGGYGTGRIIDNLQFRNFIKNPKWIIGYSDITVLHSHLYTNYYISSLHSPMAGAFNDEGFKNQFVRSLKDALSGNEINYEADPHFLNRTGKGSGELVGGNLSLLAHLCGTSSDIKTKGKILFIEDVGEYSYNIDRMMYQLKRSGKLSKLSGLIVGGFTDMKDTERPFGKTVYEIIRYIVDEYEYPVCFEFPVSHTDRNYALKIGVKYKFKVSPDKVTLKE